MCSNSILRASGSGLSVRRGVARHAHRGQTIALAQCLRRRMPVKGRTVTIIRRAWLYHRIQYQRGLQNTPRARARPATHALGAVCHAIHRSQRVASGAPPGNAVKVTRAGLLAAAAGTLSIGSAHASSILELRCASDPLSPKSGEGAHRVGVRVRDSHQRQSRRPIRSHRRSAASVQEPGVGPRAPSWAGAKARRRRRD